jgi:hypothetical protein
MDANLKEALENVSKALYTMSSVSAEASVLVEKIKGSIVPSVEELPSMVSVVSDVSEEPACEICGDLPEWVEMDKERGICKNCADHLDEGLKYSTEEFAHASAHGKDAIMLFVLRQRADNCRDIVAAAAASYDGYLELHDASVREKLLNKRAAECLARLPASFAPWWKDTWSHEKWCEMAAAREEVEWPVEKGAPIVQRLAAMFVAEQNKVHKLKKKGSEEMEVVMKHKLKEMEAKHAKELANIERARKEDMEALEKQHQKWQAEAQARYATCLAPLISVRDKMRAECEKKCEEAHRKSYAMGYAFADQKWNPVYKAVCEELELVRKEGENHQAGYIRLFGERDELVLKEADLMQELDKRAEANEKLEAQVEELRMELASAKGNLEGVEVAYDQAFISSKQVVEGLRKELTSTKADLIRVHDSADELNEELAAAQKELSGWYERCVAAQNAAKNLEVEVDAATKLFQAMRSDLERLNAENKGLRQQIEEDKQMVQRHLKEIAKENAEMTAWEKEEIERLREENKALQNKHDILLDLVCPSLKVMQSNPELFGGEARGSGTPPPGAARGASSPRPPPIIRLPAIKEEEKEKALNFLRSMLAPSRPCQLVESSPSVLPGIVEVEPSTEGMCMALTEEQYKEMFGADLPPLAAPCGCPGHTTPAGIRYKHKPPCFCTTPALPPSPPDSPLLVPDEPPACGAAGCIDCLVAEPLAEPVVEPVAEPLAEPVVEPVAEPVAEHVAEPAAKPKPNYNHPNWPSPITKRFAKHLAKHSGKTDPKSIKTHQDALEFIAKRGGISVETLLQWTMKHYQSFSEPWTLVKGPTAFDMGTAPATWWC